MSETIEVVVERPDADAMMLEATGVAQLAQSYVIDSKDAYEFAAEELKDIKERAKTLNETRLAITRPMDTAKKQVMELFAPAQGAYNHAERVLKLAMTKWKTERERELAREQAKARREQRLEEERLQAEAEAARAEGRTEEAEQLEDEVLHTVPFVPAANDKVSGISTVKQLDVEVLDEEALVRAVADGKAPMSCITVNVGALRKHVRALDGVVKIPGVRIFEDTQIRVRT